eukprot:TRINITY_DN106459_c0_g1_i1.p1 TRINITY_DN106459_c0_g1~~TRINITY_DN106459_c0_g1_i1.p1  ORF type:complete len:941 (-),score=189.20 TRINITY_DN106459_c0_g1_i1:130-2556(-)
MFEQAFKAGQAQLLHLVVKKRDETTGLLRVSVTPNQEAKPLQHMLQANVGVAEQRLQSPPPVASTPTDVLRRLLFRPEELEAAVRQHFRQVAPRQGRSGQQAVGPNDLTLMRQLSDKLGAPPDSFEGNLQQMFWRFEASGDGLLYEDEAVKFVLYVLREHRDRINPIRHQNQAVQLGIKHMSMADRYDIVKELGRGGQGVVYLAHEKETEQEIVVKVYAKNNQKESQESITQEFELLQSLRHPKIARVFEIFQDWSNIYLVQEPYFGGDLTTAVQKAHAAGIVVDERWMARVFHQILTGVQFLHTHAVVHSDLKEPNVMVASARDWERPQMIVIDFGLANKFNAKSGVGGTPGYMPPEVWEYGLWTPRGDVFSIGVMMFTLRTGRSPFNPEGNKASLEQISKQTRELNPVMDMGSSTIKRLVDSMLRKRFLDRATARILEDAWFESADAGQAINMDALQRLAHRKRRTDLHRALLADLATRKNMAQLSELNDLFVRLDRNNDGLLSGEEIRQGLKGQWRDDEIEQLLLALLGPDCQGEVTYDAFMGELMSARGSEESSLLEQAFREAGAHNGVLRREDLFDLVQRQAIRDVLGLSGGDPAADAEVLMQTLDLDGTGFVTFGEFKQAVLGSSASMAMSGRGKPGSSGAVAPSGASSCRVGQKAYYWSRSYRQWMECRIDAVDERSDAVMLNVKPGSWIRGAELRELVRLQAEVAQGKSQFYVGQTAHFWSNSFNTWMPCKVLAVDERTGAVQIDQKPNYWLRGEELRRRLTSKVAQDDAGPNIQRAAYGGHGGHQGAALQQLNGQARRR